MTAGSRARQLFQQGQACPGDCPCGVRTRILTIAIHEPIRFEPLAYHEPVTIHRADLCEHCYAQMLALEDLVKRPWAVEDWRRRESSAFQSEARRAWIRWGETHEQLRATNNH